MSKIDDIGMKSMGKEILQWLEQSGLDSKRAKIYLALLSLGVSKASELARQTKISRTAIYDNIRALEEMGYVRKVAEKNIQSYQAISPRELRERQQQQLRQLDLILPDFIKIADTAVPGEFVQVFKGATAASHIFDDILQSDLNEYCYISNPIETYKTLNRKFITQWIKTRVKKNIFARGIRTHRIINKDDAIFARELDYKRSIRYLPQDIRLSATIYIYGYTVGIIASHREQKSVLIRSKDLAFTLQQIFELLWAVSLK